MRTYYVKNLTKNALTINQGHVRILQLEGLDAVAPALASVLDDVPFTKLWDSGWVAVYADKECTELIEKPASGSMVGRALDGSVAELISEGGEIAQTISSLIPEGGVEIDDGAVSSGAAWSSEKISAELSGKANSTHTHAISQVSGLQGELSGKAAASHRHIIDDVDGLQDELDGKAPLE